ncbi:hypothetical protein ACLOJK_008227 [Asimina triloba]
MLPLNCECKFTRVNELGFYSRNRKEKHDVCGWVDLPWGYYAGENVKFSLPEAFVMMILAWNIIKFGQSMLEQIENV